MMHAIADGWRLRVWTMLQNGEKLIGASCFLHC